MRVFIIRFFFFIFLVIIAWLAGITVFGRLAPGFLQKNVRVTFYRNFNRNTLAEIDTIKGTDIMVAGSSTAFRSFDPRIFGKAGKNIFVLGSSAQSPLQTEYLVNKYIDQVKPKLFIYVANMQAFNSDGKEGWLFLLNNLKQFDGAFIKGALAEKSFILYNTYAYNVVDHILRRQQPFLSNRERYVSNGYVEYTVLTRDTTFANGITPNSTFKIDERQKAAFERTVQVLKQRNIPLLIVQAPMYPPYFESISNVREFDDYFLHIPATHYINFNFNGFARQDFWDLYHLNQNGVAKFDQMMLDTLSVGKYY